MGSGLIIGLTVGWVSELDWLLEGADRLEGVLGMVSGQGVLVLWLTFALISGFILGLAYFGGRAVIEHYTLRFILSFKGDIPWNFVRFLDYAAERVFLRKIGGGYIFIHRMLMEHFAKLTNEQIKRIIQVNE